MKLTPKQEKFCQCIIKGMNYSDAYREAYNCENMKMATINRNAFTIMNNNNITTRIKELKANIEEKLIYTALDSFKKLSEIQEKALNAKKYAMSNGEALAIDDPDFNSAIKAEELKGKLAQLYIEKKEISGTIKTALVEFVDGADESTYSDNI